MRHRPSLPPSSFTAYGVLFYESLRPAVSLNYTFDKKSEHVLSFAYGKTIARPTFYEYAPIKTSDQATGVETRGNQSLTDTLIDNFDLRYEWNFAPGEMVSIGLFYKLMDGPIVPTLGTLSGSGFFQSWQNSEAGYIRGIELEARKRFWDHWTLASNFTYIESEIEALVGSGGGATVFQGQPTYLFNVRLGFDEPDWGISADLSYSYVSEFLTDVSEDVNVPNVFKAPNHSVDFIVSKAWKNGWKLRFAAKNLLDTEQRKYYEGESLAYDRYSNGRTFGISLSYDH